MRDPLHPPLSASESLRSTTLAAGEGVPADDPVGRVAVCEAVRRTVAQELAQEAHARETAATASATSLGAGHGTATAEPPSPERLQFLAHLRWTVTQFVRARRAEGIAVEHVLPEVKRLAHEAECWEARPDRLAVLTERMVRWSIEAYYDLPELESVARFH